MRQPYRLCNLSYTSSKTIWLMAYVSLWVIEIKICIFSYPATVIFGAPEESFSILICWKLNAPIPVPAAFEKASLAVNLPAKNSTFRLCDPNWSNFSRSEEHTSELQSRFDLVCRL